MRRCTMSIAACDDTTRSNAWSAGGHLQSTLSSTLCIRKPGVTTNKQPDDIPMPTPKLAPRKLTKPVKWHGGKDYLAPRIIEEMPPHTHFVEALCRWSVRTHPQGRRRHQRSR